MKPFTKPTLVVVSGPPGSGKTRLAHVLADAIPCPAFCRDEIKEGMVHAAGGEFRAAPGDPLTQRTLPLFFDVLRMLLSGGVTVVAEAALQNQLWSSGLEPLTDLAQLRVVHCTVDPVVAWERATQRAPRAAHAVGEHMSDRERWKQKFASFARLTLAAQSIEVDTTDGYVPELREIVEFVNSAAEG